MALVFLAAGELDAGPAGYGLTASAFGAGMVLASIACTRLSRGRSATALLTIAIVATSAGTGMTGLAPVLALAVATQLIAGAGNAATNIGYDTVVQGLVPREYLGRVFGTAGTAAQMGAGLAYAAGGLLVDHVGPRMTFVLSGAGTIVLLPVLASALHRYPRERPPGE